MICKPICGDGMVVGDEKCDAGELIGCSYDCMKAIDGYLCSGGSEITPTICEKGLI